MSESFLDFEILPANKGIRKRYKWGTVEINNTVLKECFSSDELLTVITKYSSLPKEALSTAKTTLLTELKAKAATK